MSTRLGLFVDDGRIHAVAMRGSRVVWAAEAGWSDTPDLAEVLARLAAERPRGVRAAGVALGASVATVKTVAGLPPLNRADLAAHVRLRSRRYFLQNGVPLVTDATHVHLHHRPTGEVLLAAAEAPLLDAVATGLAAAGLACRFIAPASLLAHGQSDDTTPGGFASARAAAQATRAPLALLPDATRAAAAHRQLQSLRRLALLCAGSVGVAAATWLASTALRTRATTREVTRLRPALSSALAVRADLDAATEALEYVAQANARRSRHARFLGALARALPDSAFLTDIAFEGDSGRATGLAPRAATTVWRLTRTGLVGAPRLDGPVTREIVAGRTLERFNLRFREAP